MKDEALMTTPNLLLTPGPSPVPPEALHALAQPMMHHRTPQYRTLMAGVSADLKSVFRTKRNVYTFAGSGTLAMEAAVVNFCSPGDTVIVVEAGKFGERWRSIAKQHQLNVVSLTGAYGEAVPAQQLAEMLQAHPEARAVYGTLCETSTGALFDVKAMARAVSQTDAVFVVDAISGLAADRLEMDTWGVDVVVAGSQKGLMLPPGLAFLAASTKAWDLTRGAKCPRFYMDLGRYDKALKDSDTPFTPCISLVRALREVLNRIMNDGMEVVWKRTARLAQKTREAVGTLGLELFANCPANTVTAVKVPRPIDGNRLVSMMRDEKQVTIAGGQGELKGKIFRIAHFGFISEADLDRGISVLGEALKALGR